MKKILPHLLTCSALLLPPLASAHPIMPIDHLMVVMFENMSFAEIKDQPAFNHLLENAGLYSHGISKADSNNNQYAYIQTYYNNHNGGIVPTRSSQPNYIAMTSGSIQHISDNSVHDLPVDNLAAELEEAKVSWKVYADDLPDPTTSGCFVGASYAEEGKPILDGYQRKHEPFISYLNVQQDLTRCSHIVNSRHLADDLEAHDLAAVNFFIPNQINDGHNGPLEQGRVNANAFLAKMMGLDPVTGSENAEDAGAYFKQYLAQGGTLVVTFDEPSLIGNPDLSVYTVIVGSQVHGGVYNANTMNTACYPAPELQSEIAPDPNGLYPATNCNHYNLLKLIEQNWGLRGLNLENVSAGYQYAKPLSVVGFLG